MARQLSITASLMDALTEVEGRFPVTTWTVGGVPIWPLARVRWFFSEWNRHYLNATPGSTSRAAALAMRMISGPVRTAIAQRRTGDNVQGESDVLFLSDGVSYAQLGGRWVERFCDPVKQAAAKRGLTSKLLSPSYLFREPLFTPADFIQSRLDRANAFAALRARIVGIDAHLPGLDEILARLDALGFNSHALAASKIKSDGARLCALAGVHRRILQQTRPRLAFLVSYYGVEGMAFVLACRQAGVPVVDLQHGVQSELHPAYARLPKPVGRAHALVPDRFWVWSEADRQVIAEWAEGTEHSAVVSGNPWLRVWQDRDSWNLDDDLRRADALKARAGDRPVVLITLQWGLHPREQLEPMRQLIHRANQQFAFWVRLHPSMLERREEIRALLREAGRYELDEPTDLPLPVLLSNSSAHITHSSTVAVEAAQFGVRTVVTSDLGGELYARLVENGWVVKATDASEIATRLARFAGQHERIAPVTPSLDAALDELLNQAVAPAPRAITTELN